MSNPATSRLEIQEIAREALLALFNEINGAIDTQNALWTARDATFWAALGRADPGGSAEHIASENFYPGHVPSLINAPVDKYPNCSAYTVQMLPKGSDDDEAEMFDTRLAVELMCKSHANEEECNSRILRTVEAAHAVILGHRTLGGFIAGPMFNAPSVTIGDPFVRREEKSRGDRWFWQGGRLEYRLDRYVSY